MKAATMSESPCVLAGGRDAALGRAGWAKDFAFDEKTNQEMARRLKIPVYFAVPNSARGAAAQEHRDHRPPDRLQAPRRQGTATSACASSSPSARAWPSGSARAGSSQTGDLLLTFRAEWGGAGAYPNVQMGISHTGVAYIKNGVLHNIDNPLNAEYLGARGELNSEHYRTLSFIHVIRPRNLTEAQRANLLEWTTPARRQLGPRLSQADQLQPGLQRAQVQARQVARVRQAPGPDRARAEPAGHRRHVLLGVRLVAAVAQGLRPGQDRRRLQGQPRPLVRAASR